MNTASKYTQDGVNIQEGDDFSSYAGKVCRSTYNNSPFVEVHDFSKGHFRGPRAFTLQNLPDGYFMDAAPDGIGTKVVIIDAALSHYQASRDVIAMTFGDITRYGGLPLIFVNVLDVNTLGEKGSDTNDRFRKMMDGLGQVAKEQNLVVFKGETAELGQCVSSENSDALTQFNWAGMAIGVYHSDKMITGDTLEPGQAVIALREHGFRSNGISSVRKAFCLAFGNEWWNEGSAKNAIKDAATPSTLYDKFLAIANGWYPDVHPGFKVHLISHITGGGIKSKFAEDILFPRGLSAVLDDLWEPPKIMISCAEWRGMCDEEVYETWNGGQGVLVVINGKETDGFIRLAEKFRIEAKHCGYITENVSPLMTIHSKFFGEKVVYTPE